MKQLRKWSLPCIRGKLEDRWKYVQPRLLSHHLTLERLQDYIDLHEEALTSSTQTTQVVHLTLLIGNETLAVPVKEIEHQSLMEITRNQAARTVMWTKDHGVYTPLEHYGPPVFPVWHIAAQLGLDVVIPQQIISWFERTIDDGDTMVAWFPFHCFSDTEREEALWHRDILTEVCSYYRQALPGHKCLREGLLLALLNQFMIKVPLVTEMSTQQLYNGIKDPDFRSRLPPRNYTLSAVNKFLKGMILPTIEERTQKVLQHLRTLLFKKTESGADKDLTFCLCFLVMMIIGRNQVKVLSRTRTDGELGLERQEAWPLIHEMEQQGAAPIIGLAKYRFDPSQKARSSAAPQRRDSMEGHSFSFKLLAKVARITAREGMTLHTCGKTFH